MSCLSEKLKASLQVTAPAMGFFRKTASANKPRMLLLAQVAEIPGETMITNMPAIDVLLLSCTKSVPAKTLNTLVKALGKSPLGLWGPNKLSGKVISEVDFLVFTAESMSLATQVAETVGKVLVIKTDWSDSMLRTLNETSLDAVLIDSDTISTLTFLDLLCFSRVGNIVNKPLLAQVPVSVSEGEIRALWNAGVDALVVSLSEETLAETKKLATLLGTISLPAKNKWQRPHALVPSLKQEGASVTHDDDEEEDEE